MKIALAQLNPFIGDFGGNLAKIEGVLDQVRDEAPDLVVLPELCLTGYPPRDLLERSWFVRGAQRALERLLDVSRRHPGTGILAGTVLPSDRTTGKGLYNSAALLSDGKILATAHKSLLPSYDVFDETRYFDAAGSVEVIPFRDEVLGVTICEDAWNAPDFRGGAAYESDPVAALAGQGATVLVNISASPFCVGKDEIRYRLVRSHATTHGLPFILVNQVGGNDELIFDGQSMVVAADGGVAECLPLFEEAVRTVDTGDTRRRAAFTAADRIGSVHDALVLGLGDYVRKCGFEKALVGLSGGIDSAVTCCLAVAALGPGNVMGASMPSAYSSPGSIEDSRALASNLGIRFEVVPIADICSTYTTALGPLTTEPTLGITEENIQARVRGNILMALSNSLGHLVLSTGNRSELAVGYCTLYGDMSGGLSVLSDVPKTMVYELARYINTDEELIPRPTIEKPPSAELKPDQLDQDTLPPYDVLDEILHLYVDECRSSGEIKDQGFDPKTVDWIIRAVNGSEYKRRQSAPGLKVTSKAFGTGRRLPIAAKYGP